MCLVDSPVLREKETPKKCFIKALKLMPEAAKAHTKHTNLSFERHRIPMQ